MRFASSTIEAMPLMSGKTFSDEDLIAYSTNKTKIIVCRNTPCKAQSAVTCCQTHCDTIHRLIEVYKSQLPY